MYDLANIIMTQNVGLLWKILKENLPFMKQDHTGWTPMHAAAFHDEYIIGNFDLPELVEDLLRAVTFPWHSCLPPKRPVSDFSTGYV